MPPKTTFTKRRDPYAMVLAHKTWRFRIARSWTVARLCVCSRDECVPVRVPVGVRELTSAQANAPRGSARLQQLWVWESLGYSAVNSSQSHNDKVNGPFSSLIWPLETIAFHTEHYEFSAALIWITHSCSQKNGKKRKNISNHVNQLKHF